MIEFENACELAYNHFKEISPEYVLTSALEHELYWIFYGGIPERIEYGGSGIKISREDGSKEPFRLPKELKILRSSAKIAVPEKYSKVD